MTENKMQHNVPAGQFVSDIQRIIEQGRKQAYAAANQLAVITYWHIGRRIVEEEQHGKARAQYGTRLIKTLAEQLTPKYGSAFNKRNLDYFRQFYLCFSDLEIVNACVHNLTWTHFRSIIKVADPKARLWYAKEASEQMWSSRTLNRNIDTQYYGRRMACAREGLALPSPDVEPENDPLEYIKSPVVAEFLGFRKDSQYDESQLEQALIDHLQQFIMELGRGFAFVDRQKHITTESSDFYIDLVFYNIKLKRYVLFELKTHALTHADVGQLDMYVRMYDDLVKDDSDNPTIGILLCTETDNVIAKYSVLNGSEQLFAAKYMAFMPTEEELRHEIEQQKRFFLEQQGKEKDDE
jgi:predicted nuclease of restriction endonuclease-like (RecB) superfamily